MLNQFFFLKN
ncbi:Protein CBG27721 [Caenorhabditis briggsae]|uniref:Protein CBG27721 n=1 Tax=Caenorhabditis briggsae TaxID=6238 RepID=B6IJ19_CAEBR|nr:Protein CBG27721 [Caenorhabditis briggsae]CAR99999.1 Protein CBG27721 [Caenorhabditis briggsae]